MFRFVCCTLLLMICSPAVQACLNDRYGPAAESEYRGAYVPEPTSYLDWIPYGLLGLSLLIVGYAVAKTLAVQRERLRP